MGRVARDEAREIGDVGRADRDPRRQVELGQRLARPPDALDAPCGVGKRREHGVAAPETDALAALVLALRAAMTGKLPHARAFPMTALDRQAPFRHWTASQRGPHAQVAEWLKAADCRSEEHTSELQ